MDHFTRRSARTRLALAAGFLLALIAIGATVLVTGSRSRGPSASGSINNRPVPAPVTPSGGSAPRTPGACRTAPPDNVIPVSPPPDLTWRSVGAVLVPTSATEGPTRYAGPTWSCYAHSPMGAVLASYGIFATLTSPGWRTVAESEIVPGPGQRAFIKAGGQQPYQAPQPGSIAQPVGFAVASYTPQQATIETLADDGNSQYQVTQRTVAWSGGDWKLVVTPDGGTGPDPQIVSSAAGFVLWGGTNG